MSENSIIMSRDPKITIGSVNMYIRIMLISIYLKYTMRTGERHMGVNNMSYGI